MDDAPDYSLVVPAFDEQALLPATLAALRRAMDALPHTGEIVVCDNNSKDRTAEVARAAGARVAFEPVNQISRARNTGARAARGRYLVFVDADTEIEATLLGAALSALESGRACGGGATVAMDCHGSRLAERMLELWNALSRRRKLAAGSFVFARRDAFDAVGGFSEKVYASEEIWLSRRLRSWGRSRGLDFMILGGSPARTSGRKTEWFPVWTLLLTTVLFLLCPFLVRSRTFCWFWYRRPAPTITTTRP